MKEILEKFAKAQESLVTQQSDFSLSAIADMVKLESIDISPHYQRRERWHVEKQSALIESFLLNIPVPPVYFSEDEYGTYTVIDGKQRITAIYDFLTGNLRLKDLKQVPELNGFTFEELPSQLKRALSIRPFMRVITLLKQSNPELKYEVFLRLNTGGEQLKAQEIRNVAYAGPLNDLLFELSDNKFLKKKLKITSIKSTSYRNMDDLELVLRFFTIRSRWENFGKKISVAMDNFMSENQFIEFNKVQELRESFNYSIQRCQRIWGEHSFQKPLNSGWREQLIAPLFDAQMVAVSLLSQERISGLERAQAAVLNATRALYENDAEFHKSVSQSTGDSLAIRNRVSKLLNMLETVEV
ncbi:DUF262 domain-containing protein [Prochlorothrix hollandica]|uniref:GmrSD restriction endonucleases N-terminal domain-containing protein n=1 Tax=Prochlorothrix hollandica PCC 9006 = CALU 1027 TaxID=317619 RepID=A0A0M2PYH6_PROHO|nr:DUF262 domain-containing protein [Prochlorothrix hollandica]KKI99431.1 hypothetical protein PROH_12530 [Prochlorothrix hollandica PCC 9006 = CALU 1027]